MKKIITIVLLMFIFSSANCFAYKNEPNEFRGVSWGTDISNNKEFYLSDTDELGHRIEYSGNSPKSKVYKRNNEKLFIGKAKIDDIFYYAYKNHLYYIRINYTGPKNYELLRDTLNDIHGSPSMRDDKGTTRWREWHGNKVNITLSYAHVVFGGVVVQSSGFIDYTYLPTDNVLSRDLSIYYDAEDKRKKKEEAIKRKKQSEAGKTDLYQ